MHIIICIKQVPDTTEVKIDPKTKTLVREGVKSIINPFDMYAIEEGLRIKERKGEGKITVLTMGPPQAESALREAISLGCDEAILVSDKAFAGSDTLATSFTLACAIRKLGNYDLILCGKQAIDGDTAQVGPGISAHLNIPQVTYVKKIEEIHPVRNTNYNKENKISNGVKDGFARVERMTEEGYEVIQTPLPCLFTVVKEINEPRLPSLKGMLKAKQTKIIHWTSKDLDLEPDRIGLNGSPTQVIEIFTPPPRKCGQLITGSKEEVIEKLVEILRI